MAGHNWPVARLIFGHDRRPTGGGLFFVINYGNDDDDDCRFLIYFHAHDKLARDILSLPCRRRNDHDSELIAVATEPDPPTA